MTHKELERLYKGRIGDSSILCTDSHKSYIKFATDFNLEHKRIKTGKHKEGIYHIQHINSLHSNLKNGWVDLMVLQVNIFLTICNGLSG